MGNFRELRVWQNAKELAIDIYKITNEEGSFARDYKLRDQIRSASVSIASNIAEGDELDTDKQSIRHFFIAKGSTAELITQIMIAEEINYVETELAETIIKRCNHISVMLMKLIQHRRKKFE